jgi:membrane-associated protease RseP (regulator of RpoE activity)
MRASPPLSFVSKYPNLLFVPPMSAVRIFIVLIVLCQKLLSQHILFVKVIIQYGKVIRGWLGVSIQDLTPELAKHFDVKEKKGSLVIDVVKDSPAEKAGIKRGDLIVEIDRKTVENSTTLRNMVANLIPGKSVSLKVIRDGHERTLKTPLSTLNPFFVVASLDNSMN